MAFKTDIPKASLKLNQYKINEVYSIKQKKGNEPNFDLSAELNSISSVLSQKPFKYSL